MAPLRLEIDPCGDIELVLKRPNSQVFEWPNNEVIHHETTHPEATHPEAKQISCEPRLSNKEKKKLKKRARISSVEPVIAGPAPEELNNAVEPAAESETATEIEPGTEHMKVTGFPVSLEENGGLSSSGGSREVVELRMLVSSRHLSLASSTFRRMLCGPWNEGSGKDNTIWGISADEWDAEAFLIVLDIIHGKHIAVPRSVSLELLAKIAVIVDYYECHDVIEIFVDLWIAPLQEILPSSYGKSCVLWLCISWVFLRVDIFRAMAKIAVTSGRGPVETMGLPLPDILLRTISQNREEAVDKVLQMLDNLRESLCEERVHSLGCTCMLLGALTKDLYTSGISKPRVKGLSYGYGIDKLKGVVSGFSSPGYSNRYSDHSPFSSCPCSLQDKIRPLLAESLKFVDNLELEDLLGQRLEDRESERTKSLTMRNTWRATFSECSAAST